MTITTEQTVDSRLAGVRSEWVTEAWRSQLALEARENEFRSQTLAELAQAEATFQAAVTERRLDSAILAAGRLQAVKRVVAGLPALNSDPTLVQECMSRADADLRAALHELEPARLRYEDERDEWRAMTVEQRSAIDPPAPSPEDVAAIQVRAAIVDRLTDARRYYNGPWTEQRANPAGNHIGVLTSATAVLAGIEQTRTEIEDFAHVAEEANAQRAASGLTWCAPAGVR